MGCGFRVWCEWCVVCGVECVVKGFTWQISSTDSCPAPFASDGSSFAVAFSGV